MRVTERSHDGKYGPRTEPWGTPHKQEWERDREAIITFNTEKAR